jgi:hypothetical protein
MMVMMTGSCGCCSLCCGTGLLPGIAAADPGIDAGRARVVPGRRGRQAA